MNTVSDNKRIMALIVVFAIVIVFWMVFHQNGSTLTYFADDNTEWNVTGTISNSINAIWILILTFPLVAFWGFLDRRGKEPSTPTKMAIGMTLTGLSFLVLWYGASIGENSVRTPDQIATGEFRINERVAKNLVAAGVSQTTVDKLMAAKTVDGESTIVQECPAGKTCKPVINGVKFSPTTDEATKAKTSGGDGLIAAINKIEPGAGDANKEKILQAAHLVPGFAVLADLRVHGRHARRADALADGPVAGFKGSPDQQTRASYGRLVRSYCDRK